MLHFLVDVVSAILVLTGASSPEELGESEMERFQHYAEHPLRINQAGRSRLLSSGLFSAYQVASLEDYRSRSGDILGVTELGLVDGFGAETAEALGVFVSFESSLPPGAREDRRVRQSLMIRGGGRIKGEDSAAFYGAKYHLELGDRAEFWWASRTSYTVRKFSPGTFSAALYGKRGGKLVLGDFAARFGQGLALWSSFSMSGFSSVSAFRRSASGIAPTGSFSPRFRGVAADLTSGRWTVSAAAAFSGLQRGSTPEVMPMAAVSRLGRRGQFGLQAFYKDGFVASADGTLGLGHLTLFGEAALSSRRETEGEYVVQRTRLAAVGGTSWSPAYKLRFVILARHYPSGYYDAFSGAVRSASKVSGESGVSAGAKWRSLEVTADAAFYPEKGSRAYKCLLVCSPVLRAGAVEINPMLRIAERYRTADSPPWRHEYRAGVKSGLRGFQLNGRFDLVHMKATALAGYVETGWKTPSDTAMVQVSAFLRATFFRVDNWDDRIYCYERDLPGSFSVPALYGRGHSVSAIIGVKTRRHSLHLKASLLRNASAGRPSSSEIKIQYGLKL